MRYEYIHLLLLVIIFIDLNKQLFGLKKCDGKQHDKTSLKKKKKTDQTNCRLCTFFISFLSLSLFFFFLNMRKMKNRRRTNAWCFVLGVCICLCLVILYSYYLNSIEIIANIKRFESCCYSVCFIFVFC